jgi:putative ABC transport system permease protein
MMLNFALQNLTRRPFRSGITVAGVAVAVGCLACLLAFGEGYRSGLSRELDGMGVQMMMVPLGCPYDAAARVLKGKTLDVSLPMTALSAVRRDPAVAVAAPLLIATLPRPAEGRTDCWVGIDQAVRSLKPWWKLKAGSAWFTGDDSVILGSEAAATELRSVGDTLYSPETGRRFRVCGILERSGTSDDSLFFIPLQTAQTMFHQPDRLTAVAIRLKDPGLVTGAIERLQQTPGAQVVTLAEMLGTFLNLVGAVRTLVMAVAVLAVTISVLTVFNTMLASVLERTGELAILRAVGASQAQVFLLLALEAILLTVVGSLLGLLVALAAGHGVETLVRHFVTLAPEGSLLSLSPAVISQCVLVGLAAGLLAGLYPAWQASRLSPARALRTQ